MKRLALAAVLVILGLTAAAPVYKAVRVRCYHSEPISHVTTFVPEAPPQAVLRAFLFPHPRNSKKITATICILGKFDVGIR